MGNCCECKYSAQNYHSVNLNRYYTNQNNAFKSEFLNFYVNKRKELFTKQFNVIDESQAVNLRTVLSSQYLIPFRIAECWISLYIDYMIGWAYNQIKKSDIKMIPSYAIEAVLRIHLTFQKEFLKFLSLLTDGKYQLDFKPQRFASRGKSSFTQTLQNNYEATKRFFFSELYECQEGFQGTMRSEIAKLVWEDFNKTFVKKEFNFSFLNLNDKKDFDFRMTNLMRKKHQALKKLTPEEIVVKQNLFRANNALDQIHYKRASWQYLISSSLKPTIGKQVAEMAEYIDKMTMPEDFIAYLCWEFNLRYTEATIWIKEYKKFLLLRLTDSSNQIIPCAKVNIVWMLHCQYTRHYHENIIKVGQLYYNFADHYPVNQSIFMSPFYKDNVEICLDAYKKYFIEEPGNIWNAAREANKIKVMSYGLYFMKEILPEGERNGLVAKYKTHLERLNIRYKMNRDLGTFAYGNVFYDEDFFVQPFYDIENITDYCDFVYQDVPISNQQMYYFSNQEKLNDETQYSSEYDTQIGGGGGDDDDEEDGDRSRNLFGQQSVISNACNIFAQTEFNFNLELSTNRSYIDHTKKPPIGLTERVRDLDDASQLQDDEDEQNFFGSFDYDKIGYSHFSMINMSQNQTKGELSQYLNYLQA